VVTKKESGTTCTGDARGHEVKHVKVARRRAAECGRVRESTAEHSRAQESMAEHGRVRESVEEHRCSGEDQEV
jgi:hypothetical protein